MDHVVVSGAVVLFEPGPGWSWNGWNGKVTLSVQDAGFQCENGAIAVESDLVAMAKELMGKSYKATGFDDTPGSSVGAQVTVDSGTLSQLSNCGGKNIATKVTTGRFTISCVPSFKSGTPPIPDPVPMKNGTWKINDCGQKVGKSD